MHHDSSVPLFDILETNYKFLCYAWCKQGIESCGHSIFGHVIFITCLDSLVRAIFEITSWFVYQMVSIDVKMLISRRSIPFSISVSNYPMESPPNSHCVDIKKSRACGEYTKIIINLGRYNRHIACMLFGHITTHILMPDQRIEAPRAEWRKKQRLLSWWSYKYPSFSAYVLHELAPWAGKKEGEGGGGRGLQVMVWMHILIRQGRRTGQALEGEPNSGSSMRFVSSMTREWSHSQHPYWKTIRRWEDISNI
jgi:hypothetical protein